MERPTAHTQIDLVKTLMRLGRVIREIKKNNQEVRKEMALKVKEKKKLIAAKKEAKKLRKQQNDNHQ
jgi:hypothetical protein